jgi:hypothetical protein
MVPNMKTMDLKIADVERALCAEGRHSLPDMTVRDRHLLRARHLPRGGHGINAPVAGKPHFGVMTLGLVCSLQAKDVVAGYRRVRAFKLVGEFERTEDGGTRRREPSFNPDEPLEDVLLKCLHQCAIEPQFRLLELRVDHSVIEPRAYISVGLYKGGTAPEHRIETYEMVFAGPAAPAGYQPEAREYTMRLREHALMTMVKLYAINNQLPPANEVGPSAVTDEPGSMIPDNLTDRRRATTRKRRKSA